MGITKKLWGLYNGQEVYLFTISNGELEFSVTNFGCTVVSINRPETAGVRVNMVLGYDSLEGYVNDQYYVGSIVGRFANRVSNAAFKIAGTTYRLVANDIGSGNHLHGGSVGFNKKVFAVTGSTTDSEVNEIGFNYRSPDGEEGYPGNLEVFITYTLTEKNEIIIGYKAVTDKTTAVNLTSHCYFNLSGSRLPATGHELMMHAGHVLEADENYIPTGLIKPVADTRFDFTTYRSIGNGGGAANGYNDYFILDGPVDTMHVKAILRDPVSGRTMAVKTSLPGLMLYTGDYLGAPFVKNQGICLETQFYPDSPNQPGFPSTLLHPGNLYQHKTIYQFN